MKNQARKVVDKFNLLHLMACPKKREFNGANKIRF